MRILKSICTLITLFLVLNCKSSAQFYDDFESRVSYDPTGENGWTYYTGSGNTEISFYQKSPGYAQIELDATHDELNVWWGIIRRKVSDFLDISKLTDNNYELRVTARIKVSHAPRRVNLHFNTQRTTDFHSHLREYDIPDTSNWHIISMTTKGFDIRKDDKIFVQMALMDWGLRKYYIKVDFIKVEVVDNNQIENDLGNPQLYHPDPPPILTFSNHLSAEENAVISSNFKDLNFSSWSTFSDNYSSEILTVDDSKYVILRWDVSNFKSAQYYANGVLELWCRSKQKLKEKNEDFGLIRICEVTGGDNTWTEDSITFNTFFNENDFDEVINSQTIIDVDLKPSDSNPNLIVIPSAVMKRLFSGRTKGLALLPLGAVETTIYSNNGREAKYHPKLHFNTYE
jgi:hypothetical protein